MRWEDILLHDWSGVQYRHELIMPGSAYDFTNMRTHEVVKQYEYFRHAWCKTGRKIITAVQVDIRIYSEWEWTMGAFGEFGEGIV